MIWKKHIHKLVLRLPDCWSNWNLEMMVFEERGKPEYPEKNLSEHRKEPTTNSTHMWRRHRNLNQGHTELHCWEASALTTALPLAPQSSTTLYLLFEFAICLLCDWLE